jgi:hypothetical protein
VAASVAIEPVHITEPDGCVARPSEGRQEIVAVEEKLPTGVFIASYAIQSTV